MSWRQNARHRAARRGRLSPSTNGRIPIPYGERTFEINFDFIDQRLVIETSDGDVKHVELRPRSVADFYGEVMSSLRSLEMDISIHTLPNEVADPVPFEKDDQHASYDPEYANRFWRILVQTDRVFKEFRAKFIGKCSPVHFFWGSLSRSSALRSHLARSAAAS